LISSGTQKNRIYDNGERERNKGLDKEDARYTTQGGTKQSKMLNEQLQFA
jgi:hypothetical protein